MSFVKFNWPTKEQIESVARYWQFYLIGGMFFVLISSNVYVYFDNQQTRQKVDVLNQQIVDYLYKDHTQMLNGINHNSDFLDKVLILGKENQDLLKELLKQHIK